MRITRAERLRGRDEIHRVFEAGFSARRGRVIARFVFAEERPEPLRFGVATSRKISSAVVRNRCKRWMREAVRMNKIECVERLRADRRSADVMFVWIDPAVTAAMNMLADVSHSVCDLLATIAAAPVSHEAPSDRAAQAL